MENFQAPSELGQAPARGRLASEMVPGIQNPVTVWWSVTATCGDLRVANVLSTRVIVPESGGTP